MKDIEIIGPGNMVTYRAILAKALSDVSSLFPLGAVAVN